MPTYYIKNEETGDVTTEVMTMAAMSEKIRDGKFSIYFDGAARPLVRGNPKPDAGFREVLKTIERGNPGSNVNTWD